MSDIFVENIKFPRATYDTTVSSTEELYCLIVQHFMLYVSADCLHGARTIFAPTNSCTVDKSASPFTPTSSSVAETTAFLKKLKNFCLVCALK